MTKRVIRYGSLFSGIGAFDAGIEAAFEGRLQMVWNCERDEYPRRVLKKHFPNATQFQDVREVGAKNLEPVDIIIASPPCTDVSFAGKRAGLAGDHSSLWFEYMRIIRELRPRLCLFENTFSACSPIRERGTGRFVEQAMLGRVLGDLAESGYDAWWRGVRVSDVDGPHKRDRLFVVAYAAGERERESADKADAIAGRGKARTVAGGGSESELADADSVRGTRARNEQDSAGWSESSNRGQSELADADEQYGHHAGHDAGDVRGKRSSSTQIQRGEELADPLRRRLETDSEPNGRSEWRSLANVDGQRQGRKNVANPTRERVEVQIEDEGAEERTAASGSGRRSRSTLPELDRDARWSACGLDGTDADRRREEALERHFARGAWPARPGEAQREGEPPRTELGIDFRAQRLKAIGNVVSPPVALAVGLVARAIWEHEFDE